MCCGGIELIDSIILRTAAIDLTKALDPSDPDDFVRIVARLSRSVSRATRDTEAEILRKAIQELDVDWASISAAQRGRVIKAANTALEAIPPAILPAVDPRLESSAASTIRGTRAAVQGELGATIGTSLSLGDQRMIRHLTSSQYMYITDEYARRRAVHSRTARRIVASHLEQGLGRDAIAEALNTALGPVAGLRKSEQYWNVISAAFTNRARTFGHLSSYADAGVEKYIIEAVLDEATTEQCRFLHNKRFTVSKGLDLYRQAEELEDPTEIKNLMPWPRTGKNADGETDIFIERNGERTTLATITRSGMGTSDDVGEHKNAMSSSDLDSLGVGLPPYHGLCRTTVVADV